jgi:hypothetical protein
MRTASCVVRLLTVLGAAGALSGCDVVVTSLGANSKAEEQWSRTYPVTAGGQVEILNTSGEISVTGGDGAQVEVVAERTARAATDADAKDLLKQIEIREDVTPARVRLETHQPSTLDGRRVEVRYHVKVPASVSVRVQNTNGEIVANALKGAFRAETTNGGIRGQGLSGQVEASTTNGGVRLQVDAVSPGGVRVETVNGGVDLTIPAAAQADVRAGCVNGGISLHGLALVGGESTRRRVEGKLNGGGALVSAETTNGGVRITGK